MQTGRREAPPDDKLRKSGEEPLLLIKTITPHPNPLPKGEGAHPYCGFNRTNLISLYATSLAGAQRAVFQSWADAVCQSKA